jgi:Xaa-Pro aminopeptidase
MPAEDRPKEKRLKRIRSKVSRLGIDALLLTGRSDILYLSGFHTPGAALLVPNKGKPLYFVDRMNLSLAQKALRGMRLQVRPQDGTFAGAISEFVLSEKVKKIGYDPQTITVSAYSALLKSMPKVKFLSDIKKFPAGSIVATLRKIKGSGEIRTLKAAAKATVGIWKEAKKSIKPGMDERRIAGIIDICVRESGYENSFPTIAASGENTAYPHAVPMGRCLKRGEHLLVDFGIKHQGYCSDLTRIWADGRIGRKIELLEKHVRFAQDKAIKKLKPGVSIGELAGDIDRYFKNNNLGEYVCHGLGHGIGLDVHEAPFLRESSRDRLKQGMVVTIEPGLYVPRVGGVRIEDMALITRSGCEVLTK